MLFGILTKCYLTVLKSKQINLFFLKIFIISYFSIKLYRNSLSTIFYFFFFFETTFFNPWKFIGL